MNIFINYPGGYIKEQFGINDKVYAMISYISKNMDIKNYTMDIDTLGITPIIMPDELCEQVVIIRLKSRMAYISIHSSFEDYVNANTDEKIKIIVDNIKKSLQILKQKLKSKFDLEMFLKDLEQLVANY